MWRIITSFQPAMFISMEFVIVTAPKYIQIWMNCFFVVIAAFAIFALHLSCVQLSDFSQTPLLQYSPALHCVSQFPQWSLSVLKSPHQFSHLSCVQVSCSLFLPESSEQLQNRVAAIKIGKTRRIRLVCSYRCMWVGWVLSYYLNSFPDRARLLHAGDWRCNG